MSKGLIINEDVWYLIEDLLPKEQNELLKCLAAYHREEEVPQMSRMVKGVFHRIVLDNGRQYDERSELSEIRRQAALKRWAKENKTSNANDIQNDAKVYAKNANDAKDANAFCIQTEEKERSKEREDNHTYINTNNKSLSSSLVKRFVPPTVDDVRAYAEEKGYKNFAAERFCDFYESKGWVVGKDSKMKDWRAAVRGWAARDRERQQGQPKPAYVPKDERKVNYDSVTSDLFLQSLKG